jgi:hypothetical protein
LRGSTDVFRLGPGAAGGAGDGPGAAAAQAWPYLTYGSLVTVGPQLTLVASGV